MSTVAELAYGRTVGVAVIAANRHQHLERTVASLGRQTRPPDRVVVVDLGSSPRLRDVLGGRPEVEVVELTGPGEGPGRGPWPLARARNTAAAALGTDVLVFLDVDCIAAPDLVATYERAAGAAPGGLLCGPVRYLRRGWSDDVADREPGLAVLEERSDPHPVRPAPAADELIVSGDHERFWSLAFGVVRPVWSDLGGFDEAYVGYGGEDTDFALRARAAGVPLAWFGGGTAFHQWHPGHPPRSAAGARDRGQRATLPGPVGDVAHVRLAGRAAPSRPGALRWRSRRARVGGARAVGARAVGGGGGHVTAPTVWVVAPGNGRHGVVGYARRLAPCSGARFVDVPRPEVGQPWPPRVPCPRPSLLHLHYTDQLFGDRCDVAADRAVELAAAVAVPTVVTLHDVPEGDGTARDLRRADAYRRVAAVAGMVVVGSSQERDRLRRCGISGAHHRGAPGLGAGTASASFPAPGW